MQAKNHHTVHTPRSSCTSDVEVVLLPNYHATLGAAVSTLRLEIRGTTGTALQSDGPDGSSHPEAQAGGVGTCRGSRVFSPTPVRLSAYEDSSLSFPHWGVGGVGPTTMPRVAWTTI